MNRSEALKHVRDEWRRNPRLRLGGWLIAAILLLYAVLLLSDARQGLQKEYSALAAKTRRMEALAKDQGWVARAEAARTARVQMETRLWRAETKGLAQANLQNWTDQLLKRHQLTNMRTQVDAAVESEGRNNLWQVTATVDGPLEIKKLYALVREVEANQLLLTVEQLEVFPDQNRFKLVFKAPFLAPSA